MSQPFSHTSSHVFVTIKILSIATSIYRYQSGINYQSSHLTLGRKANIKWLECRFFSACLDKEGINLGDVILILVIVSSVWIYCSFNLRLCCVKFANDVRFTCLNAPVKEKLRYSVRRPGRVFRLVSFNLQQYPTKSPSLLPSFC